MKYLSPSRLHSPPLLSFVFLMATSSNTDTLMIHEITKITPFSTSTSSTTAVSLPLTFFDTLWFKFLPVGRLFFYQLTDSTSTSSPHYFNSVILPNLKHSLSLTLSHYLPLAGNLLWPPTAPKPAVYYSPNDGVSVTVAESSADFNSLTVDEVHEAVDFHPLVPELFTSDDKAEVISIRITYFPNQGFCIGISCHHAILDGKSTTMFMKSWAYVCKRISDENYYENNSSLVSLPEELTPFFDRSVIKDPTGLDMVYVNNWLEFSESGSDPNKRSLKILPSTELNNVSSSVRATFVLNREDIKELRDKISEKGEEESKTSLHLSAFVLTLAFAFVCIIEAKRGESDRNILFGFTADHRRRLDPPVPLNYLGNTVWPVMEAAKAGDLTKENGVVFVAEKLSDSIKRLENKEYLEEAKKMVSKILKGVGKVEIIGVAGSTRFGVYESDFGWGRPRKVEIVSIDRTGAISLAESRDGSGGVEVGVVLEKKEMQTFASLFAQGLK